MAKLHLGEAEITPVLEVPTEIKKYGIGINDIMGNINEDGEYEYPTVSFNLDMSDVKKLPDNAFMGKFYQTGINNAVIGVTDISTGSMRNCFTRSALKNLDLSSLTTVSGDGTMLGLCLSCAKLENVDLSSLTTVTGNNTLQYLFSDASKLENIDLSSLTTIEGSNVCFYAFGNTGIESIEFSSLTTINGTQVMARAFYRCLKLTSVSFPSLTEILPNNTNNQFSDIFLYCTNLTEIHFPAAIQERIEGLSGYATKFGATNATIYFDL